MFAFIIEKSDIKDFMMKLFLSDCFDKFDIREIKLKILVSYDIDCRKNNDFVGNGTESRFASWKEMRKTIHYLISGQKKPLQIKLVFSVPEDFIEKIGSNAAAAFININYENEQVKGYSGFSQKVFSLDRGTESKWDRMVEKFLKKNEISYTKV